MKEIKGPTLPARVQRVQKVQKVQRVVVGALQNKGRQYEKMYNRPCGRGKSHRGSSSQSTGIYWHCCHLLFLPRSFAARMTVGGGKVIP